MKLSPEDPYLYKKALNKSCTNIYNTADTLAEAMETCTDDKSCKMIYNTSPNDGGPFHLCNTTLDKKNSDIEQFTYLKRDTTGRYGKKNMCITLKSN